SRRNGEVERLGGLQIDNELELGRLQHRQVGRLLALEDAGHIGASLAKHVGEVRPVADQSAALGELAKGVDRRYRMARRQRGQLHRMAGEQWVGADQYCVHSLLLRLFERRVISRWVVSMTIAGGCPMAAAAACTSASANRLCGLLELTSTAKRASRCNS